MIKFVAASYEKQTQVYNKNSFIATHLMPFGTRLHLIFIDYASKDSAGTPSL